jgi:hypothetical protein
MYLAPSMRTMRPFKSCGSRNPAGIWVMTTTHPQPMS